MLQFGLYLPIREYFSLLSDYVEERHLLGFMIVATREKLILCDQIVVQEDLVTVLLALLALQLLEAHLLKLVNFNLDAIL